MSKKAEKIAERAEAIAELRKILKPGDRVHCTVTHVSRSGISRRIAFYVPVRRYREEYPAREDGTRDYDAKPRRIADGLDIRRISHLVARAIGDRYNADDGTVTLNGCGMDMGFHAVYSLGRVLFPRGFKVPKGGYGRNGDTSGFDKDGGYALRKEWM